MFKIHAKHPSFTLTSNALTLRPIVLKRNACVTSSILSWKNTYQLTSVTFALAVGLSAVYRKQQLRAASNTVIIISALR